ncbi:MAG: DUF4340 domain-containing protein [Candidatus Latescibacteria bacterium]|nr:DUF4340 domain-containing protein [Candidatus Latescibacterota bacterium]NIM22411.1 DUF4340 domain-containing protein [Candidatus Latescibacterota bacterium]NIM64771.1 DUF4340 domain-containing protein [Candidatus Latescibacterota bacterium]NIO01282.1 DUF4340 domain-containing protein [Candidatus Latescibacterota bacterium]NIO27774.1 DUF4340 domain-containing protein [Candidatus Latescibacterota bacterium]
MKLKKEYMVLAVIVVALLLYILFKSPDKTHYRLPEVGKIVTNDISKLVIVRPTGALTLERQGDKWRIQPQGYPADQNLVDRMLKTVGDFELSTLVSESKNYTQFDLTEDKKISLEVFGGEKSLRKLDIGKTASTYQHTFVRLEGDHRVYQAKGNIRQPLDTDIDRLRDKTVATIERDYVTGISLKIGEETLTVKKREEPAPPPYAGTEDSVMSEPGPVWATEDGLVAKENIINGIINTLANLRCSEYIEGKNKEDFTGPMLSITVESTSTVTLEIFDKRDDNKYPAISSQSDYPFLLAEGVVNRIKKTPDELLVKAGEED